MHLFVGVLSFSGARSIFRGLPSNLNSLALPAAINIGPCPATPAYPPTTCPRSGPSWDLMHVSRGPSSRCFAFASLRLGRAAPRQPALRPLCCGLAGACSREPARAQPPSDRSRFIYTFNFILRPSASTSISDLAIFACCCVFFFFYFFCERFSSVGNTPLSALAQTCIVFLVRRVALNLSLPVFFFSGERAVRQLRKKTNCPYLGEIYGRTRARSPTRQCFGNFSPN